MANIRLDDLRKELKDLSNPEKAVAYLRYFKTAPGDYGHGDKFYGIKVPDQRKLLKKYLELSLDDIDALLRGEYHEERFIALQILVHQFKNTNEEGKKILFDFYLNHIDSINNWDLVDSSAPQIVGGYLNDKPRDLLFEFANSSHLWKKRISMLATGYFIGQNDFSTTLEISEILLHDSHDLIHKAVGWMLREVGKRDRKAEQKFLDKHAHVMPRTMLRYAIEKFPENLRKEYLIYSSRKKGDK